MVFKYETLIKACKHLINILDIALFAGNRIDRIQREADDKREHRPRRQPNE